MDAMQQEMQCKSSVMVWEVVVEVKQETVKGVLEECPDQIAEQEAYRRLSKRRCRNADFEKHTQGCTNVSVERWQRVVPKCELNRGAEVEVDGNGQPD